MKTLTRSARNITFLVQLNMDRFLVPLTLISALTLAGWMLSYATTH